MEFSSKLVEQAVEEISKLPGIGKKTALRLALHLLKQPEDQTRLLTEKLKELRHHRAARAWNYCNQSMMRRLWLRSHAACFASASLASIDRPAR